jgi:hypothetical protein
MAPKCTLNDVDRESREREWLALRKEALISESHTDAGSVSVFEARPNVKYRIEALIEAEHDCCSHLRFKISEDGERIAVEVTS